MAKKKATLDARAKILLDKLIDELRLAVPKSYADLTREFPDLCGFAVGTTYYIEFIVPIFQRAGEVPEDEPFGYERFSPPEWAAMNDKKRKDTFGPKVEQARAELSKHSLAVDAAGDDVRNAFHAAILELLVELDAESKLGAKTDDRYLTIWNAGDDGESLVKASKKLNTKKLHKYVQEAIVIA